MAKKKEKENPHCYYCRETKNLKKISVGSGTMSNPRDEILVCQKHKNDGW